MNLPRHDENLHEIERIVDQMLREAFKDARSYQLSCRAHMGKASSAAEQVLSLFNANFSDQQDDFL